MPIVLPLRPLNPLIYAISSFATITSGSSYKISVKFRNFERSGVLFKNESISHSPFFFFCRLSSQDLV